MATRRCYLLPAWILATAIWAAGLARAAEQRPALVDFPLLPIEQWRAQASEGDRVSLEEHGGCLALHFDLAISGRHQQGNYTYNQSTVRLLLHQPAMLSQGADRVVFEAAGHEFKTWSTRDDLVQIWPIIRDEHGELLSYVPQKYPTLAPGRSTWSRWMTPNFYCGEAGGATSDIFEAEGGDGNAWPDGRLAFAGFEVIARSRKPGRKSGTVLLGSVQFARGELPQEDPYFYADSLVTKAGTYRFAGEFAKEFQGLPAGSFEQTIRFDPADPASGRQRLAVPLGKSGDYWISYGLTDGDGALRSRAQLRYRMSRDVDAPVAAPTTAIASSDPNTPPAVGHLRINPDRPQGGVYEAGEPMVAQVRAFAKGRAELTVSWQLLQYAFDTPVGEGSTLVKFADAAYQDIQLNLPAAPDRDAYRLRVIAKAGDATVDDQEYVIGRHTDLSQPRMSRPGRKPQRELAKRSAYYHVSYTTPSTSPPKTEDAAVERFARVLDEAGTVTQNWVYAIDPAQVEVLPGVFDFSTLDRILDAAADRGVLLTVRISHIDQDAPFRWVRFSRQHNWDGQEIDEYYYGGFALTDPEYLQVWHRLNKAVYDRYHEHRAFCGYYLLQPAGEATVEDKPFEGVVAGYEKPSELAFRTYLRERLGLSLDQLNARWHTQYAAWDEVLPPKPTFQLGAMPDLRMSWVDFSNFKFELIESGWFPAAVGAIRKYAPDALIITYGSTAVAGLAGAVDYLHNGGNHYLQQEGKFVDYWEQSTGWISEPHHPSRWAAYGDPADRGWVLDWTVFVATAQAGGGGANLHVYYDGRLPDLQSHYGGALAYDRFQKFRPILDELTQSRLVGAKAQVAVLQDRLTLACKHRTTFLPRLEDLRRWAELLRIDSIPNEPLRDDHLGQYKLVLPNVLDEVMSDQNIRAIDTLVRDRGAKVMISAITGKFCPQRGDEPWQLLRQLGIDPPKGQYVQNEPAVTADVVQPNPLFATGRPIAFFTLAQLQRDLQSDAIKADFWKYPYRWIPQTDYFGYFRDNKQTNGDVWLQFPSGGVAVSRHNVGKGEVVVFWGIPDYRPENLPELMSKAAEWAGITNPRKGNPIPLMLEAHAAPTDRHFVLLYHEVPGRYTQRIPTAPDGPWFVDELVCDRKLGTFTGAELRQSGLPIEYLDGCSPLQVLRLMRPGQMHAPWIEKYRAPATLPAGLSNANSPVTK